MAKKGRRRKRKNQKKRWILISLLLLAALCLGVVSLLSTRELSYTSPYTKVTYKIPSPVKALGIDVSQHQESIDWQQVRAGGIDFAFVRAARRGTTTGALAADARYQANIEGAQAAGLKVGVYLYSQAITVAEAEEEAAFMISLVANYNLELPIVMDYEFNDDQTSRLATATLSPAQRTEIVTAFCAYVRAQGYTPMVYTNAHMLKNNLDETAIHEAAGIWYAYYGDTLETSTYPLWQYTENGAVDGISTKVDCDFSFVELERLNAAVE